MNQAIGGWPRRRTAGQGDLPIPAMAVPRPGRRVWGAARSVNTVGLASYVSVEGPFASCSASTVRREGGVPLPTDEGTPGRPGLWERAGWKHSAMACSPSPPLCWTWTSRCIRPKDRSTGPFCQAARLHCRPRQLPRPSAQLSGWPTPGVDDRLARADPILLPVNLVTVLVVAFLPFPTRLVTDLLSRWQTRNVWPSRCTG